MAMNPYAMIGLPGMMSLSGTAVGSFKAAVVYDLSRPLLIRGQCMQWSDHCTRRDCFTAEDHFCSSQSTSKEGEV
jgi:hypothetical protein